MTVIKNSTLHFYMMLHLEEGPMAQSGLSPNFVFKNIFQNSHSWQ